MYTCTYTHTDASKEKEEKLQKDEHGYTIPNVKRRLKLDKTEKEEFEETRTLERGKNTPEITKVSSAHDLLTAHDPFITPPERFSMPVFSDEYELTSYDETNDNVESSTKTTSFTTKHEKQDEVYASVKPVSTSTKVIYLSIHSSSYLSIHSDFHIVIYLSVHSSLCFLYIHIIY